MPAIQSLQVDETRSILKVDEYNQKSVTELSFNASLVILEITEETGTTYFDLVMTIDGHMTYSLNKSVFSWSELNCNIQYSTWWRRI